jgi:hypothetical protein
MFLVRRGQPNASLNDLDLGDDLGDAFSCPCARARAFGFKHTIGRSVATNLADITGWRFPRRRRPVIHGSFIISLIGCRRLRGSNFIYYIALSCLRLRVGSVIIFIILRVPRESPGSSVAHGSPRNEPCKRSINYVFSTTHV